MSTLRINIDKVFSAESYSRNAKKYVDSAKSHTNNVRGSLDSKIIARNGIGGEINFISNELESISSKIDRIRAVVNNSAEKYLNTEYQILQRFDSLFFEAYGRNATNYSKNSSLFHSAVNKKSVSKNKSKQSFLSDLFGKTKAVYNSESKKIQKYLQTDDGKKLLQYGKSAKNVGLSIVGIVGSAAVLFGGGPVTLGAAALFAVSTIAAGNSIINTIGDSIYAHYGVYEEIGKHNALKEYLTSSGEMLGEDLLDDKDLGRTIGKSIYTGVEAVTFLDNADSLVTSYGKINTLKTGRAASSVVWGSADNVKLDGEIAQYVKTENIKKINSAARQLYFKTVKSTVDIFDESNEFGNTLADIVS